MLSYLESEGLSKQDLQVIPNWRDPGLAPLPRIRQPNEPFTIGYSSNLGRAHSVEGILGLIEQTRDLPLQWLLIGGGAGHEPLKAELSKNDVVNVRVEGYAPKSGLSVSLARSEAHLISLDRTCKGLIHPSKLFGILASGRPALFLGSPRGAVADILRQHDAGMTLDSERPETWRPLIEHLLTNPARLTELGHNARVAYERCYTETHALATWREVLMPPESDAARLTPSKRAAA